MTLNEKISIEEVIDETLEEMEAEWAKYVAGLCKECGAEPGESHLCEMNKE